MGLPPHLQQFRHSFSASDDRPLGAPSGEGASVPHGPPAAPVTAGGQRERRRMLSGWTAGTPLWMQRVSLVVFVVFCIELGILLTVLPWTRVWTENSLLLGYPSVQAFMQQGFVRGLVSGIGLIDIWIGIWEAVHYTETTAAS